MFEFLKDINGWVYAHSKKPTYYKEVKHPPKSKAAKRMRPQDARQVLYNKWCKDHNYYSGSYLPYKDKELINQGWKDKTNDRARKNAKHNKTYKNEITNQTVEYHKKHINKRGEVEPTHYHWDNPNRDTCSKNVRSDFWYLDKFGNPCKKDHKSNSPSHIKPHHTRRKK